MVTMTCCCCGAECPAMKQWWNRDNGFSICKNCVRKEKERGATDEDLKECYGVAGVHYEADPDTIDFEGGK